MLNPNAMEKYNEIDVLCQFMSFKRKITVRALEIAFYAVQWHRNNSHLETVYNDAWT